MNGRLPGPKPQCPGSSAGSSRNRPASSTDADGKAAIRLHREIQEYWLLQEWSTQKEPTRKLSYFIEDVRSGIKIALK